MIRQLWLGVEPAALAALRLRVYWDGDGEAAIDVPAGAFFCNTGADTAAVNSEMVVVAPTGGLNSYWPMPFRSRARIEVSNTGDRTVPVGYQVTYLEQEVPREAGYLHARWRRAHPLGRPAVHTVLDDVPGPGRFVGTYLTIAPNAPGRWGEGAVKFYFDGDTEFPTICGTGTADYFGGHGELATGGTYSTPYLGVVRADDRFGMYRWHVRDPICFQRSMRVTVQALGRRADDRYLPLEQADIATVGLWYQHRAVLGRRHPGSSRP
ncbi:glycoside hydrolase family 172 protein [Nocardia sp. NPDC004068]|uniref:glycoside hydrolase family 172 protein n=1 Tax=Nocardia sp. NPDC004068 TaxID=3364303 RepID=UPI0036AF732A